MYGTIARLRVQDGKMDQLISEMKRYENVEIPGHVNTVLYVMDANPNEVVIAAVFDSKESYRANADDPAQHERYLRMRALLSADPEWNDGEVISTMS